MRLKFSLAVPVLILGTIAVPALSQDSGVAPMHGVAMHGQVAARAPLGGRHLRGTQLGEQVVVCARDVFRGLPCVVFGAPAPE